LTVISDRPSSAPISVNDRPRATYRWWVAAGATGTVDVKVTALSKMDRANDLAAGVPATAIPAFDGRGLD
jgi:hypothetical protein